MEAPTTTPARQCRFCRGEVSMDALKCRHCGEWLSGAPSAGASSSDAPRYAGEQIYAPGFDAGSVPAGVRVEWRQHSLTPFSPAGFVVLNILTLGVFGFFHHRLKHSQLPLVASDDYGAGRAIGRMFIPFYNWYWIFVSWQRLADRINFQYSLRGLGPPLSRSFVTTCVALRIVPYVGIVSSLVLMPIVHVRIQRAVNWLALADR